MRRRTLLGQVLLVNLLLVAGAVVAAAYSGEHEGRGALILGLALSLTLTVNVWLLQRRFAPLERLIDDMEKVDLSLARTHVPASLDGRGETEEVERLEAAFLRMLDRLEAERRRAGRLALRAQEEERARVARDLHDEVNQALTGVLLRLEATREKAPPELVAELAETKALANRAMEELLSLARTLRPTALDDLGLRAALDGLVSDFGRHSGLNASFQSSAELADVPDDVQLVIYRVAQESLSNVAQHSAARHVSVRLERAEGGPLELEIADDGEGFVFADADSGLGLAGMRERALLINGDLTIESGPGRGTRIALRVGH